MISHDEARIQNHEKLSELMQNVRSIEIKLEEATKQKSDWSKIETQYMNELRNVKREAKEISDLLFGEKVDCGCPAE